MKIFHLYFFVFVTAFAVYGCDNSITDEYSYGNMSVQDVIDITVNNKTANIKLLVETPSPCWKYHHSKIVHQENETLVTVIGKDKSLACIMILGSFETEVSIVFETSGEKLIKFWKRNDELLEVKINIP